jgi:hypothetical protein
MNREHLEALENEVNTELKSSANSIAEPITDGVVEIDLYLDSQPKILWILKEPVDEIENGVPRGGGFSMTKDVLAEGKLNNRPPFAPMAYVTYSVFNNFKNYSEIDYVTENSQVKEAIKRIAYINISKMPALSTSGGTDFASIYRQNRHLLLKQINGMKPDVIIGGSTLNMFYSDLGLRREEFTEAGHLTFCRKDDRLYIDAYHPSRREYQVKTSEYVDEIVSVIKTHSPVLPPPQSPIVNRES